MIILTATPVVAGPDLLGEGPVWDDARKKLWWVDIIDGQVRSYDPDRQADDSWQLSQRPTSLGLSEDGRLIATLAPGNDGFPACIALLNPEERTVHHLSVVEGDQPGNRPNDGRTGPDGRYWFGTMMNNIAPDGSPMEITASTGALYSVDGGGTVIRQRDDIGISNTFAWTPDGQTLITGDSREGTLYQVPFDGTLGSLGTATPFITPSVFAGGPDGSAMAADGVLWNARWDGEAVIGLNPSGDLVGEIKVPARRPTSCAFGGPQGRTLYITSSADGLAPVEGYHDGALFAVEMPVGGVPIGLFKALA